MYVNIVHKEMQQWWLVGLSYGRGAARTVISLIKRAYYSDSFSTATPYLRLACIARLNFLIYLLHGAESFLRH